MQSGAQAPCPRAGSTEAARRLFEAGPPIRGTLAERYLPRYRRRHRRPRRIALSPGRVLSRDARWPASGIPGPVGRRHRRSRSAHEPASHLSRPGPPRRRSARHAARWITWLGTGVRFGPVDADILLVGEGIETVLSMAPLLPEASAIAALSAAHASCSPCPRNSRRF